MSFLLKNIFSITNKKEKNGKVYKVITILGIKFKIKNENKTLLNINNELRQKYKTMQYKIHRYCPDEKRKLALEDWYFEKTGSKLDLENPKTFNEKIQWLKLYDATPLKTQLADKYLVRDWVEKEIGGKYLVSLLGVWDDSEQIDFDKLPNQFVLKCNHGCGYNIIVTDKSKIDLNNVKSKLNKWMNEDFAFKAGFELQYSAIPHKIIAEEYVKPELSNVELQCWYFDGNLEFISYENSKNTKKPCRCILSKDWQELDFKVSPKHYMEFEKTPTKISQLPELIEVSEKLAKNFNHVRIDFIIYNDCIKFREMTFTSGSGLSEFEPKEKSLELGNLIKIENVKFE